MSDWSSDVFSSDLTASTIYNHFVTRAIELHPRYVLMITPSRWFSGAKGLDEYRERMIEDRRIRVLVDNPKNFDCFPGLKIRGSVTSILGDRIYSAHWEFSSRFYGVFRSIWSRALRKGHGVLLRAHSA